MDKTEIEKIRQIDSKINNLYMKYSRLPPRFQDYFLYENFIIEKEKLEQINEEDQLHIQFIYTKTVIIYFGNQLKYTSLVEKKVGDKKI